MTVRELFATVRRLWLLALAVFVLVFGIGVAAAYLPPERYRSTATLIVQPRADRAVEFGQAVAAEFLLPTVVRQLEAESFTREVRAQGGVRLGRTSAAPVEAEIEATNEPGTGIVTVDVTAHERAAPQVVANLAAQELLTRDLSPIIEIRVLDPAQPAKSASAALRPPILFGSAIFALIAAVVSAVAYGTLWRRIDTGTTIRDQFGLEILGELPSYRRLPLRASELFGDARHRQAAEEYQRLRTVFEIVARGRSAVAVTSWTQGEGKTTVTANLAWTLAAAGRPLLAVDCDLRRPQLHARFGVPHGAGVAEVGSFKGYVRDLAHATELPNLDVMTAGEAEEHPAELLRSAIPQILEAESDRLVLIDTPPSFTPETTTIATMIDAVVIVLDGRRRQPSELEALVQDLRLAGTEILGVVINRARVKRSRHAAGYYYGGPAVGQSPAAPEPQRLKAVSQRVSPWPRPRRTR